MYLDCGWLWATLFCARIRRRQPMRSVCWRKTSAGWVVNVRPRWKNGGLVFLNAISLLATGSTNTPSKSSFSVQWSAHSAGLSQSLFLVFAEYAWPWPLTFKLGLMTYRCLHGQAPRYLADHVTPAIEVASRHRLRSANRYRLIVPRCRLDTYGRRAFPVAGPTVWNSLPDELRDPACDVDSFKQFFKTILFSSY